MDPVLQMALAIATPIGAAIGAYTAVRVEINFIWRELRAINIHIGREKA